MKVVDILGAAAMVGLNYLVKADDEEKNRQYAKAMGWGEDGLMVTIMNETDRRRRIKRGYKF